MTSGPDTRPAARAPLLSVALSLCMGLALWSCGGGDGAAPAPSVPATPAPAPNRAPTAVGSIPEQMLTVGADPMTLDLASSFSDPDGDPLSYGAVSDNTAVVQASVSGNALTLTAIASGTAEVTVTASDPGGLSGTQTFQARVRPSFTVSGTVSDSRRTGLVLPGAVVQLENGRRESVTTGPDGRYRFLNVSGTVTVRVAVEPSYVGQAVEVTVDADRALDFALEHTGTPPFEDAPWITPDILGPSDPSSLRSVTYAGRGMRWVWDDRPEDFVTINAYLFDVQFAEEVVEFVMNPEFGSREAARAHVDTFTPAMGRLPNLLLSGLREVWVNAVLYGFAANSTYGSLSLGTDQATRDAVRDGFLEEILLHEGAHVSLEMAHQHSSGWRAAQEADGTSISNYAHAHPDSEDLAESFVAYFAVKYRPERLSAADRFAIVTAMPNRLAYFEEQGFDMSPYTARGSILPSLNRAGSN